MSEQDPKPNEGMGCSMHFRQKEGCPICEAVSVAYAPRPTPRPVAVYIKPRFDSEGRPSCVDCAFAYIDYGGEFWTTRRMCTIDRNGSGDEPGPNCPIHSPQEQQEPL